LNSAPKGQGGGNPVRINGAASVGASLINVDNATTSQTDWLLAGDYIQIGTGENARLYMVVSDADTNGSGEATIQIWPNLQQAVVDNQSIGINGAVGCFFLNAPPTFETDNNSFTRISFSASSVV
jgi:hypothetical protein